MKSQRFKDKVWVQWQGRLYGMPVELKKSRGAEQEAQELVAPFSCKVLKIHAKPGSELKKGDPVIVVEAMKMEYSYASPKDGVVDSVAVKEGEIVTAGTHFIRWKNA
jgi:3-methylcrotonyl-CoA carboxylase alpha subunit